MPGKRVVLIIGGEHHPFEAFGNFASALWSSLGHEVEVTRDRDALLASRLKGVDVLAAYTQGGALSPAQEEGLLGYVAGGGAFLAIHGATASWKEHSEYIAMVGGVFRAHGPVAPFQVHFTETASPITQGLDDFEIVDELYLLDRHDPGRVNLLAYTLWEGRPEPMLYTRTHGRGRVCYLALGHDERAYNNETFQALLGRSLQWCAGEPGGI